MKVLITGIAGFIGFHLAEKLIQEFGSEVQVYGVDSLNDYYSKELKFCRLRHLGFSNFSQLNIPLRSDLYQNLSFEIMSIENSGRLKQIFIEQNFSHVYHLAAQAGVRYSVSNPDVYISSNIAGFLSVLECCKDASIQHLVYASSSSVYGLNTTMPFKESSPVDQPASLYAATKKSNELMAHAYSHLFQLPTTGLRFFTVYGPWGRPDMAYYKFADRILNGEPIQLYNFGNMERDFTYIEDIVVALFKLLNRPPTIAQSSKQSDFYQEISNVPYRVFNIGQSRPINLDYFVDVLEGLLGKKAKRELLPMQSGDVLQTFADVSRLEEWIDFRPQTSIETGLKLFTRWFLTYHSSSERKLSL